MPFARIDLAVGKSSDDRKTIGHVIYEAMITTLDVPADDRFQVITEHAPENLSIDRTDLGIERTDDCILIQVTLDAGRTVERKKAFFEAVADGLRERLGLRRGDVVIHLVEVDKVNGSFGNGIAQYAP